MDKDKFKEKIENDEAWTNDEMDEVLELFDDMETIKAVTDKHCRNDD